MYYRDTLTLAQIEGADKENFNINLHAFSLAKAEKRVAIFVLFIQIFSPKTRISTQESKLSNAADGDSRLGS